jgi:hypothetical protein
VLSLIKLLRLQKSQLLDSSGFIVEYRNVTAPPSIRFLFHRPISITTTRQVIYRADYGSELTAICNANGWCPIDKLISLIAPDALLAACDDKNIK